MKPLIYILIFSFISTILPSKELAKLPFLIEHYQFHKNLDAKLSIIDFIELHYSDCQNIFGDESEDMKLPFKSAKDFGDFIVLQFIESINLKLTTRCEYVTSNFNESLFHFLCHAFVQTSFKILQPPKL